MSTEIAKADVSLQREASKTSAEKSDIVERPNNQLPALHDPEVQDASPAVVHAAIRPKMDYSSLGAFFRSFGR
jgi:hypothetical protein